MSEITRINLNGKEYLIKDNEAQIVIQQLINRINQLEKKTEEPIELDNFEEGSIFIGLMNEADKDNPITYEYLTKQMEQDNKNNKAFNNTDLPIKNRYEWKWDGNLKTFFILVPATHKNLYMLSSPSQHFTGWDEDVNIVNIDFPSGTRRYKLFRFCNWLVPMQQEITYTF